MAKKKTWTRKDKTKTSRVRKTTGANHKTDTRKVRAAAEAKPKVKAQAVKTTPKPQPQQKLAGSNRAEGVRLFKLAGRPSKEQVRFRLR
jgi:type II secretory pathway component PulM